MRALISVSDKRGLTEIAAFFVSMGVEIISTGGTYAALEKEGIKVTNISSVTNFPECFDGRVKTLHPKVHGGILAKRDDPSHIKSLNKLEIESIDIVIVNLYPFKQTISKDDCTLLDAIENIDIGGPAMLRSAAKNFNSVSVVVDPSDYTVLMDKLKEGSVPKETNFYFSVKAFEHTAAYDSLIASYLRQKAGLDGFPERLTLTYELKSTMRYGENQHQKAAFYKEPLTSTSALPEAIKLHGKDLSFNNINDTNGAVEILKEFEEPAVVVVKHATPCGVSSANTIYDAFMKAYEADKVSIFGGIIAANREIDEITAEEINKLFIEVVIAPSFSAKSLDILMQKQNIRLLKLDTLASNKKVESGFNTVSLDIKKTSGGLLVQEADNCLLVEDDIKYVTKETPSDDEKNDLLFALKIVKHVKSNAIVIAKNKQSVGIGAGQTSRIGALKQAIEQGRAQLGAETLKGAVIASDAFFPKDDCVIEAALAGISSIIQPGGSVGDDKSIIKCNEHGISMIFTGIRHFKH